MRDLSPTDAAYIAGFLDGEGWFGVTRRKRAWAGGDGHYLRPAGSATQKIRAPLDWIKDRVSGTVSVRNTPHGVMHELRFHTGALRWMIPQILPHLIVKRRQAELVLQFIYECKYQGKKLTVEQIARREGIRAELDALNTPAGNRMAIVKELCKEAA